MSQGNQQLEQSRSLPISDSAAVLHSIAGFAVIALVKLPEVAAYLLAALGMFYVYEVVSTGGF